MECRFCDGADHHLWERYSDGLWHCTFCKATSDASHPCLRCGAERDILESRFFCPQCQRELEEMQDGC